MKIVKPSAVGNLFYSVLIIGAISLYARHNIYYCWQTHYYTVQAQIFNVVLFLADDPEAQRYPVHTNQPSTIAYPVQSANYYPTNRSTYPPTTSTVVVHATGFPDTPVTVSFYGNIADIDAPVRDWRHNDLHWGGVRAVHPTRPVRGAPVSESSRYFRNILHLGMLIIVYMFLKSRVFQNRCGQSCDIASSYLYGLSRVVVV